MNSFKQVKFLFALSNRQDEDAVANLRGTTKFRVKIMRTGNQGTRNHIVACRINLAYDFSPSISMTWTSQIPHILQKEIGRLLRMHDSHDVKKQGAPSTVFEALLMTGLREWLARESGAKDVVVKDLLIDGLVREV